MDEPTPIHLIDSATGETVAAEIVPATEAHLAQLAGTWVPAFLKRYQQGEQDEDFLWDWPAKWRELRVQSDAARCYVVTNSEAIQGSLLLVREVPCGRLVRGAPVVYIDSVATAPWNRHLGRTPGRFAGVGSALLQHAIKESQAAGCHGRLGLHSLNGSDAFYRKQGFHEFGPDPLRRGKTYFELKPTE